MRPSSLALRAWSLLSLAALAAGAPFAPRNLLVVRTSGGAASLDEYTLAGTLAQSLAVPGCTLGTGGGQAYGSNSADGAFALFGCGTAVNLARLVVRVSADGTVDSSTTYNTAGQSNYLPRGVSSADGSRIYVTDGHGVYLGAAGASAVALNTVNWCVSQYRSACR